MFGGDVVDEQLCGFFFFFFGGGRWHGTLVSPGVVKD